MHESIPLPANEIHLWLAYYDAIDDERLHDAYRGVMNDAERMQELRFRFARDRRRYLVTRAMVRTVLSRYASVRPEDWAFTTNAYGRPEIDNPCADDLQLSFNLSHTNGLIVLGITHRSALGVDIENIKTRTAPVAIADNFFAPSEVVALAEAPEAQRQYRFFEYWTFKESYIKARGMGLALPLDKFSFHLAHDRKVEIDIRADLDDDATRWRFWQFQPTPDYLIAVCAERLVGQSQRLLIRQIAPMSHETLLAMNLLRTSE